MEQTAFGLVVPTQLNLWMDSSKSKLQHLEWAVES